jgi:hypothetical protein
MSNELFSKIIWRTNFLFGCLFCFRCFVYNGPFVFLTKNFIDIVDVYRLWVSACIVLLGILVVWFYFIGPWPIIQYYQAFYLYNLSHFTLLNNKNLTSVYYVKTCTLYRYMFCIRWIMNYQIYCLFFHTLLK